MIKPLSKFEEMGIGRKDGKTVLENQGGIVEKEMRGQVEGRRPRRRPRNRWSDDF